MQNETFDKLLELQTRVLMRSLEIRARELERFEEDQRRAWPLGVWVAMGMTGGVALMAAAMVLADALSRAQH